MANGIPKYHRYGVTSNATESSMSFESVAFSPGWILEARLNSFISKFVAASLGL